ncbi:MAG: hypothetical protein M3N02_09905 [Pseudomonadota bacterium]|nr:hypothetical protein [Pseudomonadota bacterium]
MIAVLLLAAAPLTTAVDAEIAFARDAKRLGQWSAFRKWADRDAVMFTPHAVWAKTFLKRLKDPPRAITWRPAQTYSSCDGRTAVNIGPWFTQDHHLAGYFTTVWQRSAAGWRWVYDGGVPAADGSAAATPKAMQATCTTPTSVLPIVAPPRLKPNESMTTLQDNGRGQSADQTLGWDWKVTASGERTFRVYLWNGRRYSEVIHTIDPAPAAK